MPEKQISHYRILGRLGQGGMGVVYRAHDEKLDRDVAIKLLPPSETSDPDLKARFMLEAKTASAIEHPNIGTIYEIDETDDGDLFIVMAFLEGETLRKTISAGPLPLEKACNFSLQIAQGMAKAHSKQIVHRDLKPANVIVTIDDTVKIIDFGLAKLVGGMNLTMAGSTLGTLAYMSPEQLRGEDVGPAGDIWALGVMLYEMLAGFPPFRGEFEAAVMYSIANEDPAPIGKFRDDLPPYIVELLSAILQKDPGKRPASMDDVARALRGQLSFGHPSSGVTVPKGATAAGPAVVPRSLPRQWWLYVAGALALVSAGIFVYSLLNPSSKHHISPGLSKSIAVLPLTMAGEAVESLHADAMAMEIKRYLKKYSGAEVVSTKSAQYFFERAASDSVLFSELGVNFLVSGQLRPTAAGLTFDMTLTSAEPGVPPWKSHFAFARNEIQMLPAAAAADLAGVLDLPWMVIPKAAMTSRADAYDAYLQALHHEKISDRENIRIARENYLYAIGVDSNFVPALVGLALLRLEEYDKKWDTSADVLGDVERYCRTAIRCDSTEATAHATLGMVLDIRGRREEGMKLLEQALSLDPENFSALSWLGRLYMFELGKPMKALVIYEKLHRIEPADFEILQGLGASLAQTDNYRGAIDIFRRAEQLAPRNPAPLFNMGYAYEHLSLPDSAELYYRKTLDRDSNYSYAVSSLAGVLIAGRRLDEAGSLLKKSRRNSQDDLEILYLSGIVEQRLKRTVEAQGLFTRGKQIIANGLREDPSDPSLLAYHGLFSSRLGEPVDLAALAGEVLRVDSIHEASLLGIVRLFALTRQKPLLLKWFARIKGMNDAEYNEGWLMTAVDFEDYRKDPDLLDLIRK
jgi:serine/threonine protein kinase/tetratricopeptide (TPR) repeat protein